MPPSAHISAVTSVTLEDVWERFVPVDLTVVFPKARGPIPPVVAVENQTGRWDTPGRSRTVVLGDGRKVNETITSSDPSDGARPSNGTARFGYTVDGFTGPLGLLTKEARGQWTFNQVGEQVTIEWTYMFIPTSVFAQPILSAIITLFWTHYMRDGMANVVQALEHQEN